MINRTGLNGLNRNLSNPKGSQDKFNNSLATLNSKVVTGRVTDIVLDENHPKFNEVDSFIRPPRSRNRRK